MTNDGYEDEDENVGAARLPEPADLLSDPVFREHFEESAAAFEVADIVRLIRQRAMSRSGAVGITQLELAARTGLSQPRISQRERGTGRDGISYSVLRKIAYACGFDLGETLRTSILARGGEERQDVGTVQVSLLKPRNFLDLAQGDAESPFSPPVIVEGG